MIPVSETTPSETTPSDPDKADQKLARELDAIAGQGGVTVRGERPFWLGPKAAHRDKHDLGLVKGLMPMLHDDLFRLGFISTEGVVRSALHAVDFYIHQHNAIVVLRVTLEKVKPSEVDLRTACPEPDLAEVGYQFYAEWETPGDGASLVRCWICTDNNIVTFLMTAEDALAWALAVHTLYETLTLDQIKAKTIALDPEQVGKPNKSTATFVG